MSTIVLDAKENSFDNFYNNLPFNDGSKEYKEKMNKILLELKKIEINDKKYTLKNLMKLSTKEAIHLLKNKSKEDKQYKNKIDNILNG